MERNNESQQINNTQQESENTINTQKPEDLGYVPYEDFKAENVINSPPEKKTVPGTGPNANPPSAAQNYHQLPLLYKYGNNVNEFYLEGCELSTSLGIQSNTQSNKTDNSIMVKFNPSNENHQKFLKVMNELYLQAAQILDTNKMAVNYRFFNLGAPEAGLKNPIYVPFDKTTGEILVGRAPSMFMKLFKRGKPPMGEQTLFTDIKGKPIDWDLLRNVEMSFIPLIYVKRIYVGTKASLQMEVASAIVTSVRARGSTTRQLHTLERLRSDKPELVDTVAAQLAKLTIDRQDQLSEDKSAQSTHEESKDTNSANENTPTFSNLTPSNTEQSNNLNQSYSNSLNQSQQNSVNNLAPSSPYVPQSMQDFTSHAPARPDLPSSSSFVNTTLRLPTTSASPQQFN